MTKALHLREKFISRLCHSGKMPSASLESVTVLLVRTTVRFSFNLKLTGTVIASPPKIENENEWEVGRKGLKRVLMKVKLWPVGRVCRLVRLVRWNRYFAPPGNKRVDRASQKTIFGIVLKTVMGTRQC